MLTDIQITDLANRMGIPLERCCFKNEIIDAKLVYNKVYILNLQDDETDGKPNEGTHWTSLYVRKSPNGLIEPIYFDSFGLPPSECIKSYVKHFANKYLPYNKKDIQSLVNEACGWYSLAFSYWITAYPKRTGNLYHDVEQFLELFYDLNTSTNYKANELMLKQFFRAENSALRKQIEVISPIENITREDG